MEDLGSRGFTLGCRSFGKHQADSARFRISRFHSVVEHMLGIVRKRIRAGFITLYRYQIDSLPQFLCHLCQLFLCDFGNQQVFVRPVLFPARETDSQVNFPLQQRAQHMEFETGKIQKTVNIYTVKFRKAMFFNLFRQQFQRVFCCCTGAFGYVFIGLQDAGQF